MLNSNGSQLQTCELQTQRHHPESMLSVSDRKFKGLMQTGFMCILFISVYRPFLRLTFEQFIQGM